MEQLNVFFDFLFLKTSSTSIMKSLVYNSDILLLKEESEIKKDSEKKDSVKKKILKVFKSLKFEKSEKEEEKEEIKLTLYEQFYDLHTWTQMKWNLIEKHFIDYKNIWVKSGLQYGFTKLETNTTCNLKLNEPCALFTVINTDDHKDIIKDYILKVIRKLRILIENLHFIDKYGNVLNKTERKEDQTGNILIKKKYWEPLYDLLFESFEHTRKVRRTEDRKMTSIEEKKNITKFAYMLHSMSLKDSLTAKAKIQYIKEMDYEKKVALNFFNTKLFGLYQKPNFIDEAIETFNFLDPYRGGNKKKKNRKTRKKSQNKRRKSKLKKTKKNKKALKEE